jgi:hypothetical protein
MSKVVFAALTFALSLTLGCIGTDAPPEDGAYAGHGEASDFEAAPALTGAKADAVSASFDRNFIVSDAFFGDTDALDADEIQAFLEHNPYGGSSWLADEFVGNRRASAVIAEVSRRHNLNPVMLLARFQVEGSHISRQNRPSTASVNRALGCGCFDGERCRSQYLGLDRQIDCAAETLEKRYQGSVDGTWEWRQGHTKNSLDGLAVTPRNHATASLYAYTPWVLVNRGGNWLVWNVTKKYIGHIQQSDGTFGDEAWVGTPCETDDDCGFVDGDNPGFCYDFTDEATGETRGFCSVVCEGYCPDSPGEATTFCIASDTAGVGICTARSEHASNFCGNIPGTVEAERDRFVGSSGAQTDTATVCAPNDGTTPIPAEEPWIGTPCQDHDECEFSHRDNFAFCYLFTDSNGDERGFCAMGCQGICPDRDGEAQTFCIDDGTEGIGVCVPRSQTENDFCADIPGTTAEDRDRYIGTDYPSEATATVCTPE